MHSFLAAIASVASLVLQALRLRVRAAQTEATMEDARDAAAARLRDALAHGRIADAAAAKADHDAINARLDGAKPKNRKTSTPKR